MTVAYGTHDRADGKAVEIVVNKDKYSENDRRALCAYSCFYVLGSPSAERCRAACLVHDCNKSAEQNKEHKNTYIVGIGNVCNKAVENDMGESLFKVAAGIDNAADYDTDDKRRINLFCYKCENNSYYRRKKRKEGCVCLNRLANLCDSRFYVAFEFGVVFKVSGVIVNISLCGILVRKVVFNCVPAFTYGKG